MTHTVERLVACTAVRLTGLYAGLCSAEAEGRMEDGRRAGGPAWRAGRASKASATLRRGKSYSIPTIQLPVLNIH